MLLYKDVLTLVSKTKVVDEYGDTVETQVKKDVFCKSLSVGTVEFYQAQTVGTKPELKFVIADYLDYDDQTEVIYEDTKYKVLRTYRKGIELEITVYGGVRNAST